MKEPTQLDHYRALGLSPKATRIQIESAFRKLVKKHNMDKTIQRLHKARDVLLDHNQRRAYDADYARIRAQWENHDRQLKKKEAMRATMKAFRARFSERIFVFRCATEDLTVILPSEGRPTYIEGTPPDDNDGRTIIDLTDEESDVIHAYIDYLYEEEVDIELCKALRASGEDLNDVASIDLQHEFLAKLYVFGEKIHDKAFCDEVLDTIAQRIDEPDNHGDYHFPHPIATRIIYEGTPEDSPVRTMLVDLYAEVADAEWLVAGDRWSHPVQFLNDVLKRLLDARSPVAVWEFGVFRRRKEWHKRR